MRLEGHLLIRMKAGYVRFDFFGGYREVNARTVSLVASDPAVPKCEDFGL